MQTFVHVSTSLLTDAPGKNFTIHLSGSRTRLTKVNSKEHLDIETSQPRKFFERISECERETEPREEKYQRGSRVRHREPGIFETGFA